MISKLNPFMNDDILFENEKDGCRSKRGLVLQKGKILLTVVVLIDTPWILLVSYSFIIISV